jgi:hypothetical protein
MLIDPPGVAITNNASTGSAAMYSMPLERTILVTQIERGIEVDRTSFASLRNARVLSDTEPLNHIHGSRPLSRKTMYGCAPTPFPRSNTTANTNQ